MNDLELIQHEKVSRANQTPRIATNAQGKRSFPAVRRWER